MPHHRITIDIETREGTGQVPLVSLDTGGLTATDALFHLGNVMEILRMNTVRAMVLEMLGLNPDGTRKVQAITVDDMKRIVEGR